MPAPTATAQASLYHTSGSYRSVPRLGPGSNVSLAGSCYDDCMTECDPQDPVEKLECQAQCHNKCTGPPPCLGELCLFGPQRRCCPYGATCCYGYEYPSARQVIGCCSPGWECCGEGKCCEPGHACCNPTGFVGPSKCCPPDQKCCDGVCYTPGPGTTCSDGIICTEGRVACGAGCCASGETCLSGKCCKPGVLCNGRRCCEGERCTPTGCCPQDRYNTATQDCCPQGRVACKVRVWPPSGPDDDPEPYIVEQCCPLGHSCFRGECCPPGDCCEKNADCFQGKHCDKGKCCAQGQKAKFNPTTGKLSCT